MRALILVIAGTVAVAATVATGGWIFATDDTGPTLREPTGDWPPAVPDRTRVVVWAVGDADPPRSRRVARLLGNADWILYLGDVYPDGRYDDFLRWERPFGRLVERMAPTPGNHEWRNPTEGYERYWTEVTGSSPPAYYGFDLAGWRILSLNSELEDRTQSLRWVDEEVASGGNCRIAFWHRPRYTASRRGNHRGVDDLWQAVRRRVRVVLSGHDHNMQRLKRRDGVVQMIAGAGGRRLYELNSRHRRLAFGDDEHFGALRLVLTPGRLRWRFVTGGGEALDAGSMRCRG